MAKTNAKRDTSSAVLSVHIVPLKIHVYNKTNVNKPPSYILCQINTTITIDLKPNVTLLQCSVHLFLPISVYGLHGFIYWSAVRSGWVQFRNFSSLMNEWCSVSFEQYPLTSGSRQWPYLICLITVWKSKH